MPMIIGRVVLTAVLVEALNIALLFLVVALFGPRDAQAAQADAEELGKWVGPIGGFLLCFLGGWWVAVASRGRHVLNGLALGATVAGIDLGLLAASGAPFQFLFVASNLGRLVAGALGGRVAMRGRAGVTPRGDPNNGRGERS